MVKETFATDKARLCLKAFKEITDSKLYRLFRRLRIPKLFPPLYNCLLALLLFIAEDGDGDGK
jgi:hypothetical protein